ncbi:hypothetical protein [Mycobacterium sp.]|uniref:hypothetical protein n=1 Tax=Mycobacterium sp. TaxID=1785 RepID=UPI003BB03913
MAIRAAMSGPRTASTFEATAARFVTVLLREVFKVPQIGADMGPIKCLLHRVRSTCGVLAS